jgi:Leucine-rich repeat (LRR) protein
MRISASDDNKLRAFDSSHDLPKLRSLKLSKNRLTRLDAGQFTQLRTLYADNNRLETINCSGRRTKLERLSLRSQETGQLSVYPCGRWPIFENTVKLR